MSEDLSLAPATWASMTRAIEKVQKRLLRTIAALNQAGVSYAVIDDNAVAAWVARVDETAVRNTRDVDILLRRDDLPSARTALEASGFTYRHIASLGQAGGLDVFLEGPEASAREAIHIVFANEKVTRDAIEAAPDTEDSEAGTDFRLMTLEALVRMKLTAYRDKDRTHLRDLIDVGLVDSKWPARFSPELGCRLQKLLDTPGG